MDATHLEHIADEIVAAGTALAGLILVFIGTTTASFDSVPAGSQGMLRAAFRWRAWIAFAGFTAALVSVFAALSYSECGVRWLLTASIAFLGFGLLVSLGLAFAAAKSIG